MAGVWILAEDHNQTLELLNVAVGLAEKLGVQVTALLWREPQWVQEYIAHGADQVLVLPPLAEDQPWEDYLPVIVAEVQQADPDIFLLAATARLKEMAARIAARLKTGLCSGCTALQWDQAGKVLLMERLVFGGAAVQTVTCLTRPQMATIAPRTFEAAAPRADRDGQVRELAAPSPGRVKIVERKPKVKQSGEISEARILVCVD
jgi:electron transfer flavoprotein alpha subunit